MGFFNFHHSGYPKLAAEERMEYIKRLEEKTGKYVCYISLEPVEDPIKEMGLIWNYNLDDTVWVKNQYLTPALKEEARRNTAKKHLSYINQLAHEIPELGIPEEEQKAWIERSFHIKL